MLAFAGGRCIMNLGGMNMKRLLAVYSLIFALLLSACASAGGRQVPAPSLSPEDLIGKTTEELEGTLIFEDGMRAYGYGFATDTAGNPVVYEWDLNEDKKFVITHAEIFAAKDTDNSPEMFEKIQPGMTIYEVVKMVGAPSEIPATGFFYIIFIDSHDTGHAIAWGGDPLVVEFFGN